VKRTSHSDLAGCASSPQVGRQRASHAIGTPLQEKIWFGPAGPPARPPKTESSGLGWDAWLPESVNTRTLSDKPRADLGSVSRTEATLVQELQGTLRNESNTIPCLGTSAQVVWRSESQEPLMHAPWRAFRHTNARLRPKAVTNELLLGES
jgi:hypothetical protein